MNFARAFVIALMAGWVARGDGSGVEILAAAAIGGFLWFLAPDPLPSVIKRGLEDFAKDFRR